MNFSSIKNIIFDLGAVIINIDPNLTYQAFARLTNTDLQQTLQRFKEHKIFERYELGEFSDAEFRLFLRDSLKISVPDSYLDNAWNALLLDIDPKKIELIKMLKEKYQLFLLSNTNNIHIEEVNKVLFNSAGVQNLDLLFHKAYYSYKIKMSKPHLSIYTHVLNENNLNPNETVFLDDNLDNLAGAKTAGIHSIHVAAPVTILDLLKHA